MDRRIWRGAGVLLLVVLAAGALAITPATAGKFLTKKRARQLFYTKAQVDHRLSGFLHAGASAAASENPPFPNLALDAAPADVLTVPMTLPTEAGHGERERGSLLEQWD